MSKQQSKKSAASNAAKTPPKSRIWILPVLTAVVLAVLAYFYFRQKQGVVPGMDGKITEEETLAAETPLLELTNKEPTDNSRGLRLGNMVQMRDDWSEEIEAALAGKKSAKQALDDAVTRGNQTLRQFERTANR